MIVKNCLIELISEKMRREQRLISVAEVAKATGMSRQNAHEWIQNKVQVLPITTIAALCEYFNCQPGDLFILADLTRKNRKLVRFLTECQQKPD